MFLHSNPKGIAEIELMKNLKKYLKYEFKSILYE